MSPTQIRPLHDHDRASQYMSKECATNQIQQYLLIIPLSGETKAGQLQIEAEPHQVSNLLMPLLKIKLLKKPGNTAQRNILGLTLRVISTTSQMLLFFVLTHFQIVGIFS